MQATAPAKRSSRDISAGLTLLELLVTLAIFGTVGLAMMQIFRSQNRFHLDIDGAAEAHQGLNAAFDALTRDILLAGACLPIQPLFVPIAGVDNGTRDTITLRTGVVSQSATPAACVTAVLTAATNAGTTSLPVDNIASFTVGSRAYIMGSVAGEFFRVATLSASSGPGTITSDTALAQAYPLNAGVYGFEERTYTIDATGYKVPTLTRSINQGAAVPIAAGINALNLQYRLTSNCPPAGSQCTISDLPVGNPTWALLTEVIVSMTAISNAPLSTGTRYQESATMAVQPRNIVTLRSG